MVIVPNDNNDRNRHYGSCDRNYRNCDYGIKTTTVIVIMAKNNNNLIGEYGK